MKSKKKLLLLILIFAACMGLAALLYRLLGDGFALEPLETKTPDPSQETAEDESPQKAKAPDFVVYDADGGEVRLSDFAGKPVILNFWASWCGPCQMEMPDFQKKYQELGSDIQFLMINITDGSRETVETASKFIAEKGYLFPVFYDKQSSASSAYSAYSLPTTFFIDAEGYAIAQAIGAIDEETLQRGIDMIR